MAKKKLKLRPKKQTIKKLRRDKRVIGAVLGSLFLLGVGIGLITGILLVTSRPYDQHPNNVVIAADSNIQIPEDLVSFLNRQNKCVGYRGPNSPKGVGMWVVYQLSRGKFAKISYGCSANLNTYIMAVRLDNKWQLIKPTDYFGNTGFLPKCLQLEKYQIDASIEPYCVKDDAMARPNGVK